MWWKDIYKLPPWSQSSTLPSVYGQGCVMESSGTMAPPTAGMEIPNISQCEHGPGPEEISQHYHKKGFSILHHPQVKGSFSHVVDSSNVFALLINLLSDFQSVEKGETTLITVCLEMGGEPFSVHCVSSSFRAPICSIALQIEQFMASHQCHEINIHLGHIFWSLREQTYSRGKGRGRAKRKRTEVERMRGFWPTWS